MKEVQVIDYFKREEEKSSLKFIQNSVSHSMLKNVHDSAIGIPHAEYGQTGRESKQSFA